MAQEFCPHCGISSPADTRFCRVCGALLRYVGEDNSLASSLDQPILFTRELPETIEPTRVESNDSATTRHDTAVASKASAPNADRQSLDAATVRPIAPQSLADNDNEALISQIATRKPARKPQQKDWVWWLWASTCVAAIGAISMLIALNLYSRRSVATIDANTTEALALDPQAESLRLTGEAEKLIAAQEIDAGVARLREAVRLDERNARAQLQLGAALEQTGKRSEAIFFYEAAAALTPDDPLTWRQLANLQLVENRFADARQTYRRLFALIVSEAANRPASAVGSISLPDDEALRFGYAEALRGVGELEQARGIFAQLTASASPAIKSAAQARLAFIDNVSDTLPPVGDSIKASAEANDELETTGQTSSSEVSDIAAPHDVTPTKNADAAVAAQPTGNNTTTLNAAERRLTAQERYERAVGLYSSNRAAALAEFFAIADAMPDAHYYLGLARTEGRTPRLMHRAELLAALTHFQIATQRGTRYTNQAALYAEQLGREYDRRRKE